MNNSIKLSNVGMKVLIRVIAASAVLVKPSYLYICNDEEW